jgi:hypothetical protein
MLLTERKNRTEEQYMTQKVIHYDFQKKAATPAVVLSEPLLRKGRRLLKTFAYVNTGLNMGCVFLCGACSAVSVLLLLLLVRNG